MDSNESSIISENEWLLKYREELRVIHSKSQEAFEKQLSYISAGCLVLSIGYVKDIVKDLNKAGDRFFLIIGWSLFVVTLLLNLISHLWAVQLFERTITEIDKGVFDSNKSINKFNPIRRLNWVCIISLILGIISTILFIEKNL